MSTCGCLHFSECRAPGTGVTAIDIWSKKKRSEVMARIRSKDTKPELAVRRALHRMGFRFRLHRRDLPGCPDIVLPKYRAVVFVHGCFWHRHENCRDGKIPKTGREEYWEEKLQSNVRRDQDHMVALRQTGWQTLVIWECEIRKDLEGVKARILRTLCGRSRP